MRRRADRKSSTHAGGLLRPSLNKLATAKDGATGAVLSGHELPKRGVHELDLVVNGEVRAEGALSMTPAIEHLLRVEGPRLAAQLSEACPCLRLTGIDTIKLQYNEGIGGCFPMHYDTSSQHSRREVTAILYLNPDWRPGDGGELELYPFPMETVRLAPVHDRLALFNSTEMLHRVLPATAPQALVSIWFAQAGSALPVSLPCRLPAAVRLAGTTAGLGGVLKSLLLPANRRGLCMLFASAWESRSGTFGDTAEVEEALVLQRALNDCLRIRPEVLALFRSARARVASTRDGA